MLTKLTLHAFRGVGALTLDRFARVTLLVGNNGVGKTSVLEALYLFAETQSRGAIKEILDRRRYEGGEQNLMSTIRAMGSEDSIVISAAGEAKTWDLTITEEGGQANALSRSTLADGTVHVFARQLNLNRWGSNSRPDDRPHAIWFDFAATTDLMVAKRLGTLRRRNRMGDMVKSLQRVDPRVEDLSQIEEEGAPHMETFVKLQGLGEWIRLTQAGHGLRYAAALFTELDGAKDAIVLIDEIEVGLHHDVLDAVWKTIRAVAEANNLQIFATTHSYECIKAADAAFADAQDDLRLIRLQRVKGTVRAIDYPPDVRHNALEDGMEVR